MAQAALSPTLIQSIGSFTPLAVGVVVSTATTSVVTLPQFSKILMVLVGGCTGTTTPYCDTITNTTSPPSFTATTVSLDVFSYVAYGTPRV